jgi:demethylspheroidene O-methyltransferase
MDSAADPPRLRRTGGLSGYGLRLFSDPGFQSWAARFPLTRPFVRRDGDALFRLVSGFAQSQILLALVELDVFERLRDGSRSAAELAPACRLPAERMGLLLQAGAALGLLARGRDGRFRLARKGAAILGVPGLGEMIRHHALVYRDLADPVALLRGEAETELARFWPYVAGAAAAGDAETARRYSALMADSQALVAEDTLAQADFRHSARVMDLGGGTGAFLKALCRRHPRATGMLVDLPAVIDAARPGIAAAGLSGRITLHPVSFRDSALPTGADTVTLVRVLYDHDDATVALVLRRAFDALPPGGRLIVSEPMSGGEKPDPAGDVYFALYTAAMGTGKARAAARIAEACATAGFSAIRTPRPFRPYITSLVEARRPA